MSDTDEPAAATVAVTTAPLPVPSSESVIATFGAVVYPMPPLITSSLPMEIVATAVAGFAGAGLAPSRIVTTGALVYPSPGVTTVTPLTTPLASIVAVPVAAAQPEVVAGAMGAQDFASGRPNSTMGWTR